MGSILTTEDLQVFGLEDTKLIDAIIGHIENLAFMAAPCLRDTITDPEIRAQAASALIAAALRWSTNPGQLDGMEVAGPFTITTKPKPWFLMNAEIAALKKLCGGPSSPPSGLPQATFPEPDGIDELTRAPHPLRFGTRRCW